MKNSFLGKGKVSLRVPHGCSFHRFFSFLNHGLALTSCICVFQVPVTDPWFPHSPFRSALCPHDSVLPMVSAQPSLVRDLGQSLEMMPTEGHLGSLAAGLVVGDCCRWRKLQPCVGGGRWWFDCQGEVVIGWWGFRGAKFKAGSRSLCNLEQVQPGCHECVRSPVSVSELLEK